MDIETIEKFLNDYVRVKVQDPDVMAEEIMPYVTCQMLLHIYRKLEEIEEQLGGIGRNMWDK